MSGLWAAGSLSELCRCALQIGIGLALQSTLLLGLGLLAGRLLHHRGPSLLLLLYQVTLIGTLSGAFFSLALRSHLQSAWSISLPAAASPAPWQNAPDGWPAPPSTGEAPTGGAAVIDPLRLPAIPAPNSRAGWRGPTMQRAPGHEGGPETEGAAKGRIRALVERLGASAGSLAGWLYMATMAIWATGAVLLLFRLLLCQLLLARLRRRAVPLRSEAAQALLADLCCSLQVRPPLLLAGPGVHSPFLTGLRRPAILLPAGCKQQLGGPTLRLILAHELVHLARRDCGWKLLARLACAVGWMQPLLWVLCRRLEQAGEEVCDQEVIRLEDDPRVYARCLLTLSEQLMPTFAALALGVGVVAIRSSLGRRIQRILDSARPRPLPPSNRLRCVIALAASTVVVVGLFLASAIAAPPGERADTLKHILRDVRGLDRPVTYTETKIPLGELVQKVAAETGVALAAAPGVADEPVAVVVKEMPARVLLEHVAKLFDYQWSRRRTRLGWGYEILQDLASKQREAALRQAALADVEKRFQEELKRVVAIASLPPEQIRRIKEAGEQRAKERKSMLPEERAALQVSEPVSRALAQFVGRLTTAHWAVLRRGDYLIFATEPAAGELPLPAELTQLFRAARPEMSDGMHYSDPEMEASQRQFHQTEANEWAAASGFRVELRLKWESFPGMLMLEAAAQPARRFTLPRFDPAHPALITDYGSFYFSGGAGTRLGIYAPAADMEIAGFDDTAQRDPGIVTDPVFGAPKRYRPDPAERVNYLGIRPRFRLGLLRDQMPDLARTYGVQFIGDAYRITGRAGAAPPSQPAPLYAELDRLASSNDRWQRDGRVVLVRSRTWFFDRLYEVPLRFIRRWKQSCDQYGLLSLDEWVEAAHALTDLQLEHVIHVGFEADLPLDFAPPDITAALGPALRLYSALTLGQQHALWQGRSVSMATLSPMQRSLFAAAVRVATRGWPRPIHPSRFAEGRLALHREDAVRTLRPTSGGVHADTQPLPATGTAASGTEAPPRKRVTLKGGVTRYAMSTLTFEIFFGPGWPAGTRVYVRMPQ